MAVYHTTFPRHFVLILFLLISFLSANAQNLLINGDFQENDISGFDVNGNGYNQIFTPFTGTTNPGDFAIVSNPQILNNAFFINSGDHTTGNGFMLAFDGNTTGGQQRFWRSGDGGTGLCCVQAGTTYRFSYWIRSISTSVTSNATRANIGIEISNATNVTLTSGNVLAPLTADGWQQVTYSFQATSNCVNIELWNNNTNNIGNDFAIDDMMLVSLDDPLAATYSVIDLNCPQESTGFLAIYPRGGIPPFNFAITKPGFVELNTTGIFEFLSSGTYQVEVTDDVGDKISFLVEILSVEPLLDISPNQSICFGETTTVEAFTEFDVNWFSEPEDESIVEVSNNVLEVTPIETTTYIAEIEYIVDIEVIYNGDFEEGNEGFSSDYTYLEENVDGEQAAYGVVQNASSWFDSFGDCSGQTGANFLVADGATDNNCEDKVWCQSVFIIPNQEYEFVYWIQSLNDNAQNPSNIVVEINGSVIGQSAAPSNGCEWVEHTYIWNSTGTVGEICIYSSVQDAIGNDFAIDNIQFYTEQLCTEVQRVEVEIENCFCPEIINPVGEQSVCQNEALAPISADIILEDFQGDISFVYFNTPQVDDEMYTGGTLLGQVSATDSATYNFPPLGTLNSLPNVPGTYYVYAILANQPPNPNCRPFVEIPITIQETFTPTFDIQESYCVIDEFELPTLSDNGFEGVWTPSSIVSETGTYTFTPLQEECTESVQVDIVATPNEAPEFTLPTDICADGFIALPTTSDNGYEGTWSPAFDPTQDITYTFTPNEFECSTQTFSITIVSQEVIYNDGEITPIEVCDENNNGFSSNFDLNSRIDEITFANPDLEVTFHLTENDAITDINPVESPYSNVNPYQQTLYARILKTDNGCFETNSLDLIVYNVPLLEDVPPLVKCDTFEVGINFFDLTEIEDSLFVPGQDTTGFEISYHISESAANSNINAIDFPANYLMEINPQTVYVRVSDPSSPNNCSNVQSIELIVDPLPEITPPSFLAQCEDTFADNPLFETAIFDLSDKIPEITNSSTTLDVFFYESIENQQNNIPIDDILNYENIANPQSLFISVVSEDTGCVAFTTLTLVVEPTPNIPQPEPIIVCDADNDGTSEVDLFAAVDDILAGEEEALLTFHLTEVDALNNTNPITIEDEEGNSILFQVFNPFGQTLYVRAEFNSSGSSNVNDCFVVRALPLEVRESPLIQELDDLISCDDDSLNGFAPFNLVQNTNNAIGSQIAENLVVTYHVSQADAEVGLNPIAIPSNYTNITNPQTIYVRIEDQETNCFDLFGFEDDNSFTITVEPYPNLIPVDIPLRVCNTQANPEVDFPTGIFNLTDKEEELTGLSPIPANIEIHYYETEEDVLNQVNEIENPDEYINTTNPPMSIYIEAINTATENLCRNYIPFTIDVLPYPFPVELTDEERRLTACDNDNDGIAPTPFNLIQIGQQITGSENNMGTYYLTEDAAIEEDTSQLIENPEAYVNNPSLNELDENFFPTNTQVVWLRLDSNAEGNFCFFTIPIEIVVERNPELNPLGSPFGYTLCEGNPTQLPATIDVILGLYDISNGNASQIIPVLDPTIDEQEQSNYEFTLHLTEADAEEGINPLAPGYQVSSGESVYLRATHLITGCYNIGNIAEIIITIEPRPEITDATLTPIVVCADEQTNSASQAANQEVATVDLTQKDEEINPNFDNPESNTLVEYFASEEDFFNGIAITDPTNFVTTQTPTLIFAHVVDLNNFCTSFTTQSFELRVNPLPLVDISDWDRAIICINPLTGEVIETDFSPPVIDTQLSEELYSFEWTRNGEIIAFTGSVYTPTQAGIYSVTVTDITNNITNCQASGTAEILQSNGPSFNVNIVSLAFNGSHSVEVTNIQGDGEYEFSIDNGPWFSLDEGQTSIVFSGLLAGERIVRGRDNGGCGEVEVSVFLIDYPLFFTPNEDGFNDTWNIIGLEDQPDAKIHVFDRFGKLIKQLSPNGQGWDGTFNGKPMISNDYWFRVEFTDPSTGQKRLFRANFTLKR